MADENSNLGPATMDLSAGMNTVAPVPTPGGSKTKAYILVGLIVAMIVGGGLYYAFGSNGDEEQPPSIDMGGSGFQGMIKAGKQGFLEYEEKDKAAHKAVLEENKEVLKGHPAVKLKSGVNYVYAYEDVTVEELTLCMDPVVGSVLFAHYDWKQSKFLTYPKGPFGVQTKEVGTDYAFQKGDSIVAIVKNPGDFYCVASANTKSSVAASVPAADSGWILMASNQDNLKAYVEPIKSRVLKAFVLDKNGKFVKVESAGYDYDMKSKSTYLVWLKLEKTSDTPTRAADSGPTPGPTVVADPVRGVAADPVNHPAASVVQGVQATYAEHRVNVTWGQVALAEGETLDSYYVFYNYCGEDGSHCSDTPNRERTEASRNFNFDVPRMGVYKVKVGAKKIGQEVADIAYSAVVDVVVPENVVVESDLLGRVDGDLDLGDGSLEALVRNNQEELKTAILGVYCAMDVSQVMVVFNDDEDPVIAAAREEAQADLMQDLLEAVQAAGFPVADVAELEALYAVVNTAEFSAFADEMETGTEACIDGIGEEPAVYAAPSTPVYDPARDTAATKSVTWDKVESNDAAPMRGYMLAAACDDGVFAEFAVSQSDAPVGAFFTNDENCSVYHVKVRVKYGTSPDWLYSEYSSTLDIEVAQEDPAYAAPMAQNVTVRYFDNDNYAVGVSWDEVESTEGKTFESYVVKYSLCEDAAGATCADPVLFEDSGDFDDIAPGQVGYLFWGSTADQYYKVQVGVTTEENDVPTFSAELMSQHLEDVEAPVPEGVSFLYEEPGEPAFILTWNVIEDVFGATVSEYVVKYSVCDDAAGAVCGDPVYSAGYEDRVDGRFWFYNWLEDPVVGKYYKAEVGVVTRENPVPAPYVGLEFSDAIVSQIVQ